MKTKTLKLLKFKVANLNTLSHIRGGDTTTGIGDDPIKRSKKPTCPITNIETEGQ